MCAWVRKVAARIACGGEKVWNEMPSVDAERTFPFGWVIARARKVWRNLELL